MPRLRQVSKQDAHEMAQTLYTMLFGDRDPVESPGTATGTPGNWWTVFAGVPDTLTGKALSSLTFTMVTVSIFLSHPRAVRA